MSLIVGHLALKGIGKRSRVSKLLLPLGVGNLWLATYRTCRCRVGGYLAISVVIRFVSAAIAIARTHSRPRFGFGPWRLTSA